MRDHDHPAEDPAALRAQLVAQAARIAHLEAALARGQSLYAPAYAEKLRRAALARDQGAVGRARWAGVPKAGRPEGQATRPGTRIQASRERRRRGAP